MPTRGDVRADSHDGYHHRRRADHVRPQQRRGRSRLGVISCCCCRGIDRWAIRVAIAHHANAVRANAVTRSHARPRRRTHTCPHARPHAAAHPAAARAVASCRPFAASRPVASAQPVAAKSAAAVATSAESTAAKPASSVSGAASPSAAKPAAECAATRVAAPGYWLARLISACAILRACEKHRLCIKTLSAGP